MINKSVSKKVSILLTLVMILGLLLPVAPASAATKHVNKLDVDYVKTMEEPTQVIEADAYYKKSGDLDDVLYRFDFKKYGERNYTEGEFESDSTFTFAPEEIGKYYVKVYAVAEADYVKYQEKYFDRGKIKYTKVKTLVITAKADPVDPVDPDQVVVTADKASATVEAGKTATVTLTAKNGKDEVVSDVTYAVKSSDETVATAAVADGVVTIAGKAAGTAKVAVTATKGEEVIAPVEIAVTVTEPEALKVDSVKQLNVSQLEVTFNLPVLKTSAENIANYIINGLAITNVSATFGGAGTTARLQEDGKTVILEAGANTLAKDVACSVVVQNVTDANFVAAPKYQTVITGTDANGPVVQSVVASAGAAGTKAVTVTFNEPLHLGAIGTYTINGTPAVAALSGTKNNVVNLTASQTLVAGTNYTLVVAGANDGRNLSAMEVKTFTVAGDVVVPKATVAQKYGFIALTFDKEISPANFAELAVGPTIATDDISFTKQADVTPYITVAPILDPEDTTNKTVLLTPIAAVYPAGANTATAHLIVKNIKDVNGNVMAPIEQTVTLTKDTTKPTFVSATLNKTNNQVVTLEFSEPVQDPAFLSLISVIKTDDATDASATYTTPVSADVLVKANGAALDPGVNQSKYVAVTLEAALEAGTYQFTVPGNIITDAVGNVQNSSFGFSLTATAAADTNKPVATVVGASVVGGKNVINVTFNEKVQLADALNVGNYVLNGAALPAGTVVINNSATPTDYNDFNIILPANAVNQDYATVSFIVANIRDVAGNIMNTVVDADLNAAATDLADTCVPTILSAKATSDTTIELTFSELVTAATLGAGNEVTITDGTNTAVFDLDTDTIGYVGNKVTITHAAGGVGAVDLVLGNLTVVAGAFVDSAATPNNIAAIVAGDAVKVADKFVDVTGAAVATTNTAANTTNNITEISVNITAPTNAAVDKVAKYHIYMANATATDLATVEAVEANLTKLTTWSASRAGTTNALAITDGNVLSDGTVVSTLNATVDTYVIVEDIAGNKALVAETPSGAAINVAD